MSCFARVLRSLRPALFLALFVVSANGITAKAFVPLRLAAGIDDSRTMPLNGNVPVLAKGAVDLGPVAGAQKLTEMSLRFTRTAAQQAALDQLIADQQNPASPRFQQWLTPEQFGAQFGLAPEDLAKVGAWLASQGFTVTGVARGGTFIRFSGSVAQAQAAFHTQIHALSVNGEQHFANVSAPSLPASLAAVTAVITGLHDFHPKAHHRFSSVPAPGATGSDGLTPAYTSSTSGNHFIAPGDFYTIYDEKPLIASGNTGTGVTIGVMGQTDIYLSDINNFRSISGLPATPPSVYVIGTDPGQLGGDDLVEAELDLEWSGATAPGANILYVNSTDVIDGSLTQAIDQNLVPIISISYGLCEPLLGAYYANFYNSLLQMATVQGQAVVAAAGDAGATDCDTGYPASQGLSVDFPASSPTVVGVGGTMFNEGTGTYFGTTNNSNGGSATSYIPEAVWNETSSSNGLGSGGGGVSAFFAKPSWQVGTGVPADASRDVPDVSLNAASGHDGYLICTQGYCVNGYRNSSGNLAVVGGTSVGAPSFAGLLALVEQHTAARLGNPNPKIYALANSTYASSVFHDVTTGNNFSPCYSGTPNCPSGGNIGYSAGTGYDLATGWGSVDASNMVNDWLLVPALANTGGLTTSTITLNLSATTAVAGTPVTLAVSVVSGSTTSTALPTGSVQFLVDNVTVGAPVALVNGVASYSLDTTNLATGTRYVSAVYLGNATYAGSKATVSLSVTAAPAALFTLTPPSLSINLPAGTATSVSFAATSTGGFAGTVQFSFVASSSSAPLATLSTTSASVTATVPGTTTLRLQAYTTRSETTPKPLQRMGTIAGGGIALATLMVLVLPRRRRLASLLVAVVSIIAISATGCTSSGGSVGISNSNTPTGTYTYTVTATATSGSTAVTHSSVVTVVVQ